MNPTITRLFHRAISRHGFVVKREVVEGWARRLSIPYDHIHLHLEAMDDLGLWGCTNRPTIKRGWFMVLSPEGTVCP